MWCRGRAVLEDHDIRRGSLNVIAGNPKFSTFLWECHLTTHFQDTGARPCCLW